VDTGMNKHISSQMPLEFPPNPNIGDQYTSPSGVVYEWDGNAWIKLSSGAPPTSGGGLYRGIWQVAANIPNLDPLAAQPLDREIWIAQTANPIFSEQAPATLPGISNQIIWNGWLIQWDATAQQYIAINTSNLTVDDTNPIYVEVAGDTLTGTLTWPIGPLPSGEAINITNGTIRLFGTSAVAVMDQGEIRSPLFVSHTDPGAYAFGTTGQDGGLYKQLNSGIVIRQSSDNQIPQIELNDGSQSWNILDGRGGILPRINVNVGFTWTDTVNTEQETQIYQNSVGDFLFRKQYTGFPMATFAQTRADNPARLQLLGEPTQSQDAATKNYVDTTLASIVAFQGIWQVAANIPDLDPAVMNPIGGWYWVAATADPLVPERAPITLPGIGSSLISNGDMVFWSAADNAYHNLAGTGGGLTRPEADTFYVQLSGSTMTGPLLLNEDPVDDAQAATKAYVDANTPPNGLPIGGGQNDILVKNSNVDFDVSWSPQVTGIDNTNYYMNRTPGGSTSGNIDFQTGIGCWAYWIQAPGGIQGAPPLTPGNNSEFWQVHNVKSGSAIIQTIYEISRSSTGNPARILSKWQRSAGSNFGWTAYQQIPIAMPPTFPDLSVYALDAEVVHIAGDTITGPIIMENTLTLAANPINNMEAVTKQYADNLFSGAPHLVGVLDATDGRVTLPDGSTGPLPSASFVPNGYFICVVAGTLLLPPTDPNPQPSYIMKVGDQLFSNGNFWVLLAVGGVTTANAVSLIPNVFGADNVQSALEQAEIQSLPPGGTTAFVLAKSSSNDFDTFWTNAVDIIDGPYLPLSGGQLSGALRIVSGGALPLLLSGGGNTQLQLVSGNISSMQFMSQTGGSYRLQSDGSDGPFRFQFTTSGVPATNDCVVIDRVGNTAFSGIVSSTPAPTANNHLTNKLYVDTATSDINLKVDRSGDTMTGPLLLAGDPTVNAEAVNKGYVDRLVSAQTVLIGVIDATTGDCVFSDSSGIPAGPLPPSNTITQGDYVICIANGTIPTGPAAGVTMRVGDWLIASTGQWLLIAIGSGDIATLADQVAVVPTVLGSDNVQQALTRIQNGFSILPDGAGVTFMSGAAIYKKIGTGLTLRRHTQNTEIGIENNDGSNRSNILTALTGVQKSGDTMTGSLQVRSGTSGFVRLDSGNATNTGNIGFVTPDSTRRGYIGWGANNVLSIVNEAGYNWVMSNDPTVDMGIATKRYVDRSAGGIGNATNVAVINGQSYVTCTMGNNASVEITIHGAVGGNNHVVKVVATFTNRSGTGYANIAVLANYWNGAKLFDYMFIGSSPTYCLGIRSLTTQTIWMGRSGYAIGGGSIGGTLGQGAGGTNYGGANL
jgi:hypothetical protein